MIIPMINELNKLSLQLQKDRLKEFNTLDIDFWANKKDKLTYIEGRIICQVDMEGKNSHRFADGTTIRLERRYDNFNMRYVNPVNATVISAENIPEGAVILIHHNSIHDTNRVFNYSSLSGDEIASNIRYFSIPETEAFAWYDKESKNWKPLPGFDFALRVFKPYKGILEGVEPTLIKDCLYVTTGEYKGLICRTLKSCDYNIIFQDVNGREGNLIRFRSVEDLKTQRELEIVAIDHTLTEQLQNGDLIVGITKSDAKPLKEIQHA